MLFKLMLNVNKSEFSVVLKIVRAIHTGPPMIQGTVTSIYVGFVVDMYANAGIPRLQPGFCVNSSFIHELSH